MKHAAYTIKLNGTGGETVTGLIAAGLGIHHNERGYWTVTHIASGHALTAFKSLRSARGFVTAIAPLVDWTQTEGELCQNYAAMHDAKELRTAYGGTTVY